MTLLNPHTNDSNVDTQTDQERANLALADSIHQRLCRVMSYNEIDQDDWSLDSENPADFFPLSTTYTTCPSSVLPHISLQKATLPVPVHHSDSQLSTCFHQAHENSLEQFITLNSDIPHNAGISTISIHPHPNPSNHRLCHTTSTNVSPTAFIAQRTTTIA